ncbi:MAG: glycosyltransferase family 2 protein [Ruminococcaceae bacterium]|nr:glycosyltransferase family 2 protein [Oscillospiraceae bacterium]
MFFSVIVPVYRVEEYLPACIESVLHQTCPDFELILVNDGSPDKCPEICERYKARDSRIKVVHKPNGGLASARRAGIKVAEGDYVLNLDSDDLIELDTLESARKIILETDCDIISFAYRWVKDGKTVSITNDGLSEGLYHETSIAEHIYPRLLMDKNMNHMSYYLSGKVINRELLTPNQLGVSETISLGEDLCCVLPCYLEAKRIYISQKPAYLYTVRSGSLSKGFQAKQIFLIEDVIREIQKHPTENVVDFREQLFRYSCFMCFSILAAAAEGNHFGSIKAIRENIEHSLHRENIRRAEFETISPKSRISIFLMKKQRYASAFCFLNLCKLVKVILRKG